MQSGTPSERTGLTSGRKKPDRAQFLGIPIYLFGTRPSLRTTLNAIEARPVIEVKANALPPSDPEDKPADTVDTRTIEMINLTDDATELAQGTGSFQGDYDTGITSEQSDQEVTAEKEEPSIFENVTKGVSLIWASIWGTDWSCGMCRSKNYESIPEESRPINRSGN